jgi:hypothetical protein
MIKPFRNGLVLFTALLMVPLHAISQDQGKGPKEKTIKEELKSNKRIRQEKREKRKLEKAEQKAIKKHHKKIQTKAVRKRMANSRRKAKRNNDNKRENFFIRWWKKVRR